MRKLMFVLMTMFFGTMMMVSCNESEIFNIKDEVIKENIATIKFKTNLDVIGENIGALEVNNNKAQACCASPSSDNLNEYISSSEGVVNLKFIFTNIENGDKSFERNYELDEDKILRCKENQKDKIYEDGSMLINDVPVAEYIIQIKANNGGDVNKDIQGNYNTLNDLKHGKYLIHKDYEKITPYSDVKEKLAIETNSYAFKNWVSNKITTKIPLPNDINTNFKLDLQNDLYAILIHRHEDSRMGIDMYINKKGIKSTSYRSRDAICWYGACNATTHTDFLTVFESPEFSLLKGSDNTKKYSLYLYCYAIDKDNYNNYLGTVEIPLKKIIGGKVMLKEITINREIANVKSFKMSIENYSCEDWNAPTDIFDNTGGITTDDNKPKIIELEK